MAGHFNEDTMVRRQDHDTYTRLAQHKLSLEAAALVDVHPDDDGDGDDVAQNGKHEFDVDDQISDDEDGNTFADAEIWYYIDDEGVCVCVCLCILLFIFFAND